MRFESLRRSLWLFALCSAALSLQGCSTVQPSSSGRQGLFDQLSAKQRARAAEQRAIASHDNSSGAGVIRDPSRIDARLDRPTGNPVIDKSRDKSNREQKAAAVAVSAGAQLKKAGLHWPLRRVEVTSPFGKRGRDFHEGIDLRAKIGTPIYAAQSGTVLYSNSIIRGYGKMVVIKHPGGLATVYAHASRLLVRKGQKVRIGQRIAMSGKTGRASGPHLHFEVRSGVVAVNPYDFLPKTEVAQVHEAGSTVVASVHGSLSDE